VNERLLDIIPSNCCKMWWFYFSNSQLQIPYKQYPSSTSVWILHFTIHMYCYSLHTIQWFSRQSSAADPKAVKKKSSLQTKTLLSSPWTGWPLRNINFSNAFYVDIFFAVVNKTFTRLDYTSIMAGGLIRNGNCISFASTWIHSRCSDGSLVAHLFSFLCCVFCFLCLCSVCCAQCCLCLCIVHSWLSLQFSMLCFLLSLSLFCVLCPMLPVSLYCPFLIAPSVFYVAFFAFFVFVLCVVPNVACVFVLSILDCPFSFLCCIFCFLCLCSVCCAQCCLCLCIVHSWLSLQFSRTFI
jgi:hypothetical protein